MAQHHASQNTVMVKRAPGSTTRQDEWIMDALCRPGQLVEYASSTRIQVQSGTTDASPLKIVIEDGSIPTDGTYASGDQMPFIMPVPGDHVMVYATAAAISTVAVADVYRCNGAGFAIVVGSPIVGERMLMAMETGTIAADPGIAQIIMEVL